MNTSFSWKRIADSRLKLAELVPDPLSYAEAPAGYPNKKRQLHVVEKIESAQRTQKAEEASAEERVPDPD